MIFGFAAKASNAKIIKSGSLPILSSERFDRYVDNNGLIHRLHQEDLCMALGLPVYKKYANSTFLKGDDPSYKKAAELLYKYSIDPINEITELSKQMIVNFCLGNYDAHAKNYSFLHTSESEICMSPMYDVVPVSEIEPRTDVMSMWIGGEIAPNKVGRSQILNEITSWNIPLRIAEQILDNTLDNLETGINQSKKLFPNASKRHSAFALNRVKALR